MKRIPCLFWIVTIVCTAPAIAGESKINSNRWTVVTSENVPLYAMVKAKGSHMVAYIHANNGKPTVSVSQANSQCTRQNPKADLSFDYATYIWTGKSMSHNARHMGRTICSSVGWSITHYTGREFKEISEKMSLLQSFGDGKSTFSLNGFTKSYTEYFGVMPSL